MDNPKGPGSAIRRGLAYLYSPDGLFWLVAAWVFYYVTYAVWGKEAFASFVASLGHSGIHRFMYILLFSVAAYNAASFVRARFRRSPALAIMWAVLPAGALVFMAGYFLSAAYRIDGVQFVMEGDQVRPPWQAAEFRAGRVTPGLDPEFMAVDGSESLVFAYEPRIAIQTGMASYDVGVFPPTYVEGTYYHVLDFGIAPNISIRRGSREIRSGYAIQRLLPPGQLDEFQMPPMPYRFTLRMSPVRTAQKGSSAAEIYSIEAPVYDVAIYDSGNAVFRGSSAGDVTFDGLSMSFERPGYWVRLEAARDPGLKVIAAGIFIMLAGAPLMIIVLAIRLYVALRAE